MRREFLLVLTVDARVSEAMVTRILKTYSAGSLRRNSMSIPAEKAANARPPPKAAFGPAFRARTPPARKPDDIEFQMSFLARY